MLWHPMHIATRASTDFILSAGCAAGAAGAAALVAAGAWASAGAVAQATASAKSAENRFFILGAELLVDYIGGHPPLFPAPTHEVPRLPELRRDAGPDARRQRVHHPQAPAAGQGRARHRQDHARRGGGN